MNVMRHRYLKRPMHLPRFGAVILGVCAVFFLLQELLLRVSELFIVRIADEVLLCSILVYLAMKAMATHRLRRIDAYILGSIAVLAGISLLGMQSSLFKVFAQTIIHFTFFLFYVLVSEVKESDSCNTSCLRTIVNVSIVIALTGFFVSLVGQEQFLSFFNVDPLYRYGTLRIEGFQLKPNDLAIFLALAFTFIAFRLGEENRAVALVFTIITFAALVLLTGSRIALMGIAVSFIFLFFSVRQKDTRAAMSMLVVVGAPILLATFGPSMLEQTISDAARTARIEDTTYIRGIMVYYGSSLMMENFPFGTGAATFGSTLSIGSPVYTSLGLDDRSFFREFWGVYDSNIATLAGEFGVFGLFVFGFILAVIYRRESFEAGGLRKKYLQAVFFILISTSLTNPTFMYQYNGFFFALFICVSLLIGRSSPIRESHANRSFGKDML